MKEIIQDINEVTGVKNIRRKGNNLLNIELFSRKVEGSEAFKIKGNLRKISQKIRNKLETHKKKGQIQNWNWIAKPEKKYAETQLGKGETTDRKEKGHKTDYYTIEIQK
jgi:hypothetical protein